MTRLNLHRTALVIFTFAYVLGAAIYFTAVGNTEFLGYIGAVAFLLAVVAFTLNRTGFPDWLLWLLSLQMLLHILGGGVMVHGDVLYNYVVAPIDNPFQLTFLKFDQVVHTFGSAVAALFVYFFVRKKDFTVTGLLFLTVLAATGIGALNEVLEFIAKLTIPDTDVGGYYNTAVDLVVNLVGALLGTLAALNFWKRAA